MFTFCFEKKTCLNLKKPALNVLYRFFFSKEKIAHLGYENTLSSDMIQIFNSKQTNLSFFNHLFPVYQKFVNNFIQRYT